MSFTEDYLALQKKKKKEEQKSTGHSFTDEYLSKNTGKTEDIAPVYVNKTAPLYMDVAPYVAQREEKKANTERTWFEKGAFEDGYQFGDVAKTILGTGTDIKENLLAGILGMGEKVVDAGAYLVGGAGGLLGADEFKEKTADFIKKDLYNEEKIAKKIVGVAASEQFNKVFGIDAGASVLGEKSDALVQSGGQLAATIGLQAVGVPWFVTTGVTSFGGEAENALNEGAGYGRAGVSAAISAGAEILTEKISGGISFGGKALDDVLTQRIARGVSKKVVRTLSKIGLDMAGEGVEEVLSGVMSAIGQKITYADDKELTELFSGEDALESFIGGALLGGGSSVYSLLSTEKGVDFVSGLTANEKQVVDKIFADRVAEEEKSGKVTEKRKDAIYDEVLRDMERGYISTDTIEEVLGGESYQTYKQTVDSEDAQIKQLEEQIKELEAAPNTVGNSKKYDALQSQLEELKANSKRTLHKAMLSDSVYDKVLNDRLIESYNEDARRWQSFKADLTKYDTKQQETVKKAVESGILNNTNRTHEFVDMIAKISADKGVLFDFTNNEKLKESGFAVDGKTVNGYITKDGVTLNIDSHKSLNSVVGHEITHVLEGTEVYAALKQVVSEYAKTKGDYQGRYDALAKLYEGVEGADVDAELTADLVGDYLFTDEDFIRNLSVQHRNVFQKIYDEIKYLLKVATAGSKEARELEKVKRAFEKAYQESGKQQGDAKYSLSDSDGKQLTKEQQEYFKDSKMRDENGNLKVMYHGSQDAGFHVFDAQMSDDDTSFFFVDRNDVAASYSGTSETYAPSVMKNAEDVKSFIATIVTGGKGYDVVEENGKYTLFYKGEAVADSDTAQGIYEEFCDFEGVLGVGDANYKVYLNLKNPLVVDAEGRNWNNVSREFSQDVYDRYKSLTDSEKTALSEIADWGEYGIFRDEILSMARAKANGKYHDTDLASAYEKLGGANANLYDAFSIASDNFSEESLKEFAVKQMKTRDYAQRAKEQGYDGVIFNNIVDVGGYGNGDEGAATVAIAFDSNQIKSVANDKPTADADIRYSLSEDSKGRELSKEQQAFFKDSKIRVSEVDGWKNTITENGALLPVYHGTNSGEFYEFDKGSIGSANDYGWFGRGFYFAFTEGEASYYGKRVLECYLDVKRPFIYADEMETFDGRDGGDTSFDFAAFIINMSDKFPDIAKNTFVKVVERGTDEAIRKPFTDFAKEIKELYDSDRLKVVEIDDGGKMIYQYAFTSDVDSIDASARIKKIIKEKHIDGSWMANWYREKGEITETDYDEILDLFEEYGYDQFGDTWLHTRYNSKEQAEKSRLSAAVQYISEKKYSYVDQHMPHYYMDSNVSREFSEELRKRGYDGIIQSRYGDEVVVFDSNQIKLTSNKNPTTNPDIRKSLSEIGETPDNNGLAPLNKFRFYGKDMKLADFSELVTGFNTESNTETNTENRVGEMFPDDLAPMADDPERFDSLTDADAPAETEAPYTEYGEVTADDPFDERDWYQVGNQKVKAYMYENPEVKPFFQEQAAVLLDELQNTTKGEKWYNDEVYYQSGGEAGWGGTKRITSDSIAELRDSWGMSYADIEKGLNAIIEDNGAENIAAAKKIEFMLNDRLMNGYKSFVRWEPTMDRYGNVPPDEGYIKLINEKQISQYSKESFDALMANADQYAPAEEIAPVAKSAKKEAFEAIRPKEQKEPRMAKATPAEQARAEILTEEPKVEKKKNNLWNWAKVNLLDPGTVFETLSLKTGNPELQARFSSIKRAESRAQRFMEKGNAATSSLKSIRETVEKTGKTKAFYEYLYHLHNADRMSLEDRFEDVENKPVYGYSVTADMSKAEAAKLEKANPEFKQFAQDVYNYNGYLREMLVEAGVISRDTAKLWQEMYPHYVPIRRNGDEGLNINVPLDTGKTGINAPVKRATGGNRDILPLFDTMGQRTIQTFKAIAKNRFGVELKNTLGTTVDNDAMSVDEFIESLDTQDSLLQEGKDGRSPTFTVFENGEKVTFEITDEMYDAMKPKSGLATMNSKVLNTINDVRRGLITEYNPVFAVTNPIKDIQDVLVNSKHPAKTYANVPKAIKELRSNGHWYQEYMDNGGEQNTYFDGESKTFVKEKSGLRKAVGFPLDKISQVNNFIEKIPRLAEYIASREMGRSVDVSMLDAARVTTDFSAGGHIVKMMNRNGFTFLNASVQGAVQQVRNVREAKYNGLKGWAQLAGKMAVAGLPAMLLNHLLWDDDEDYAELSDYVKENYYIVGKYGDGKFVRIPKGRTLAVIQSAFEQMGNLITGNDEADLGAFGELVISNLAPNNPLDNNIIAPIAQAWKNKTWYGEDLVPTRLQDLPAAEQFDESTDAISKWLGEKLNISPYKLNYLLDQYSGGVGDTFLPMMTPEAESGNNSLVGNLLAPWKDKFTTDSVMNNQNVADFYDKKDELTVNANASDATEEDVLMNKYMNSVNADLAKLYAEKREIQNSDLPDAEKYAAVRDVQKQIVELTKEALNTYGDITFEDDYREGGEYARVNDRLYKLNDKGEWTKLSDDQVTKYEVTKAAGNAAYATDGTNHYRWYVPGEDAEDSSPGWRKITDDQLEKQEEVTKGLGISAEKYWGNKEEYDYAYEYPENYAVAKAVGGYSAYRGYSGELYDIKADKDESGKSISGSRKEKVIEYINNLDADYGEKLILFKSEYNADDTYNYEIIDYLNSRDDISYDETVTILKKLGFTVDSEGNIYW